MSELDYLNYLPGEKNKLNYLIDKVKRAKKSWEVIFTYFLTPEEQIALNQISSKEDVYVSYLGGNNLFERAVAAISNLEYNDTFPVKIIKISIKSNFEKLDHRDYLGSILSLGVRREMVGDINIFEDGAEIWVLNEISDYIFCNLGKIKHTGINMNMIDYCEAREKAQKYKEIISNVSSQRLDCIISSAIKVSRSDASNLIKGGNVKVNHLVITDISRKVIPNDIISIRGYGRFLFDDIINTTKSDRLVIKIKKFL